MTQRALVTGVGRLAGSGPGSRSGWSRTAGTWCCPAGSRTTGDSGLEGRPDDPERLADQPAPTGARVEVLTADLEDPEQAAGLVGRAADVLGATRALVMSHCETVDSGMLDTTRRELRPALRGERPSDLAAHPAFAPAADADRRCGGYRADQRPHRRQPAVRGEQGRAGPDGPRGGARTGRPRDHGQRVNPGPIDTGWMTRGPRERHGRQARAAGWNPADTANLVASCSPSEGQWINGQLLFSNGGFPKGHLPV